MTRRIFVTGTDTGVGKTHVAVHLMHHLRARGLTAVGLKPVATGCEQTPEGLRNQDALQLQAASSIVHPYKRINPFAFIPPIAPHIAATQAGESLSVSRLQDAIAYDFGAEVLVIEGVGGWLVPLNYTETMADFVKAENLEVILVVAMRLGCLNHALLTIQAIQSQGARFLGWVPNTLPGDPMEEYEANVELLSCCISPPLSFEFFS